MDKFDGQQFRHLPEHQRLNRALAEYNRMCLAYGADILLWRPFRAAEKEFLAAEAAFEAAAR